MISFGHPAFLWAGAAVMAVVALAFRRRARRLRELVGFLGGSRAVHRLLRGDLSRLPLERMSLLALAALAAAVAAAEPTGAPDKAEPSPLSTASGERVELVIDVSASMQGIDGSPTRLGTAVLAAENLVESSAGAEVGLLLLAGKAYPLTPPTADHRGVRYLLRGVTPTTGTPWDAGARLSAGVREAATQLEAGGGRGGERSVFVISDAVTGEAEEEVLSAVREAAAAGITVHTIGVGSDGGGGTGSPPLGETLLRRMAAAGGGRYEHAATVLGRTEQGVEGADGVRRGGDHREVPGPPLTFLLTLAALVLVTVDGALDGPLRLPRIREAARGP